MEAISVSEWKMLTSLVCPPDFIATLVRAIAAVAGTPPQKGMSILPTPCAISSLWASSFSFFIFPADAPQRRLSIMPRAATETAGEIYSISLSKSFTFSKITAGVSLVSRRSDFGISPTCLTSKSKISSTIRAIIIEASDAGNLALSFLG